MLLSSSIPATLYCNLDLTWMLSGSAQHQSHIHDVRLWVRMQGGMCPLMIYSREMWAGDTLSNGQFGQVFCWAVIKICHFMNPSGRIPPFFFFFYLTPAEVMLTWLCCFLSSSREGLCRVSTEGHVSWTCQAAPACLTQMCLLHLWRRHFMSCDHVVVSHRYGALNVRRAQ